MFWSTGKLTPVGMWRFLASEESNLVDVTQLGLVMDMNQPLSHYYINSSHNTYCCGKEIVCIIKQDWMLE